MNVISLFDGISCGMVALERAGIRVDRYVAYEIDKYAIEVSKKTIRRLSIREMSLTQIFQNIKALIC